MSKLTKITKNRFQNHMHYGRWYYIAAIIAAIVLVNLVYSMSAPRYPKENTVSIMMYGGTGDEMVISQWEDEILKLLHEDQRQVEIIANTSVDYATQSVVVARIAANEDDILVTNLEDIEVYANQGAFMPLEDRVDLESISAMYPDVDFSEYYMESEFSEGEEHLYYLPLNMVEGFEELGFSGENLGIGILANGVNIDNSVISFEYIVTKH